ncbi:sugar phosphate isomerase/epimerase family protein [Rhodopirellula sallentina]|uniref:Xylose isomerase domain-containing protein TIM barrel n=1 Tax=Rhodopirellula sallentina SM41 TaxID=1263870 RepID=M5U608_9BACT|nr:sugar phosphate isomerase/epimerase family protein [Rhodopirellula sallentina]EMI53286.1 Xylose isomerase domain-containing protein TIM barrel [Rhodopirellula sallentina SM41]
MNLFTRRVFLQTTAIAAAATASGQARSIDRFERNEARVQDISLSAYSFKRSMRWWKGTRTNGKMDLLDFLDYCADAGVEAAELTSYFFPYPLNLDYLNQIKRRAHLLGIDISGGAMGNCFANTPGSEQADADMDYFRQWIDRFADVGAPAVRVFAGQGRQPGIDKQQSLANVIANLQPALRYAESRGVMLGLENHDMLQNADDLLHIVETIDSPWLGVTWDSANLSATPDPYAELAKIAPHAITAQLKLSTRINGQPVAADIPRLLSILQDANYRGYVVLEYEEKEPPEIAIPTFIADVRTALDASSDQTQHSESPAND